MFEHALGSLDVQPGAANHVGDSLEWDVRGANGASMTSVWLNRMGATREDDDPASRVEIPNLEELPPVLRTTCGQRGP
jgi:putative hydrolase of the HAD superfamily